MRDSSFTDAIGIIAAFDGPRAAEVASLFGRIMDLPGEPNQWGAVSKQLVAAQLEFFPWRIASVEPDAYQDLNLPEHCGLLGAFLKYGRTLSSQEWFGCNPDLWLRVVAADVLSERLSTHHLLHQAARDSEDEKKRQEFESYLPGVLDEGIRDTHEILFAAEAVSLQLELQSDERQEQGRRAASKKNRPFNDIHDEFFAIFLNQRTTAKSKAALARHFVDTLVERYGSEKALPFRNKETTQRNLLDNLRKRLAEKNTPAEYL